MTIDEIYNSKKAMLTIADICGTDSVIPCLPRTLRAQYRQDPAQFGFPILKIGNRLYVPRLALIRYLEGDMSNPQQRP